MGFFYFFLSDGAFRAVEPGELYEVFFQIAGFCLYGLYDEVKVGLLGAQQAVQAKRKA
ncbi:MAG: hypothetical protein R2791_13980 [Saprospiraceae bacterium]